MKTINIIHSETLASIAKISKTEASAFLYNDFYIGGKVYLYAQGSRGYNERFPKRLIAKYMIEGTYGNDAPRGGKLGDYLLITNIGKDKDKVDVINKMIETLDANYTKAKEEKESKIKAANELFRNSVTEEDLKKFAEFWKNSSNKKARGKACNLYARYTGVYTTSCYNEVYELAKIYL